MHACQAIDADNGDYFRPPYNLWTEIRLKQHCLLFMKLLLFSVAATLGVRFVSVSPTSTSLNWKLCRGAAKVGPDYQVVEVGMRNEITREIDPNELIISHRFTHQTMKANGRIIGLTFTPAAPQYASGGVLIQIWSFSSFLAAR